MTPTQTKPAVDGATITGIDMSAYLTEDTARAVAFYRDVLGLTPNGIDDEGRGAEFELPDGSTFGVWDPRDASQKGGVVMFAVGDIGLAVETFRKRGAQLSDPFETPVCFMSQGADPDGNGIIIHQRKNAD